MQRSGREVGIVVDSDVISEKADETVTAAAKNRRIKLRLSNRG